MTTETRTLVALTAEHPEAPPSTDDTRPPSLLDRAAMLLVALVAAAASYGHMYEVAATAGENEWIARLFPISVDGLALIALRRGRVGRWWLAVAIVVSIAANVAAAQPTIEGRLVAAWPPLALLGTHRLIHGRHQPSTVIPAGSDSGGGAAALPPPEAWEMPADGRAARKGSTPVVRAGRGRAAGRNGKRRAGLRDVAACAADLRAEGLPVNRTLVTKRLRAQDFSLANERADIYLAELANEIASSEVA